MLMLSYFTGLVSVGWCCIKCSSELSSVNAGSLLLLEKALITVCLLIVYYYRGVINSVILPFTFDKDSR